MTFPPYACSPKGFLQGPHGPIASFLDQRAEHNVDSATVASFGQEWQKFDKFSAEEVDAIGSQYFDLLDDSVLNESCRALDVGCGSGRWSLFLAGRVGAVEAIEPSGAVVSAAEYLKDRENVRFSQASVSTIPFEDDSFDVVFSLGVLHHVPDTQAALNDIVRKCRIGGRVLVYLYYNFDNRGRLYRSLFLMSDVVRRVVSRLPGMLKELACDTLAVTVYLPLVVLARGAKLVAGDRVYRQLPLSYYVDRSWRVIRNDCRDRFGTPLEKRFSREEIAEMMAISGLERIRFSETPPYWKAVGVRVR